MKRILFLIHDLGQGGAEKVLVNLVNNMDHEKFDITVIALFGGGVNEQFLDKRVKYRAVFPKSIPGNSHIMKLLSPAALHRLAVKEHYDIEISYLEGPCARIISGCKAPDTKLVSWIHCTMTSPKDIAKAFRNEKEAVSCYDCMDKMVFVSEGVRNAFLKNGSYHGETAVLYNTIESEKISKRAEEDAGGILGGEIAFIAVGTLKKVKGFDRLLRIVKRLRDEQYPIHLYLLGAGPMYDDLKRYAAENNLEDSVSLMGYQVNPYRYLAKCDLFVCSSYSEGFSTAATEALIVGTPVCTVDVSGMKELLGESNEYGIVTENSEEALYQGIKSLLDTPELLKHYRQQAITRGEKFSTAETVGAVQEMLLRL